MCERLRELRGAMKAFSTGFDPGLVSASDAEGVVADASAIEKMAATVKALAAARVAETSLWRKSGERSPAHHLARRTGSSVGQAASALQTAKAMAALPQAAAAARAGELSPEQAAAVADAAGVDPSSESELVAKAKSSCLSELKDHCARAKAAATDAEQRRRRIHKGRYLRTYTDTEGAWNCHVKNNPEVGAEIMSVLGPMREGLMAKARAEGRNEPVEAHGADALTELARTAGQAEAGAGAGAPSESSPTPAKILVRVDLDALVRGYPVGDEVAEVVGYGPVAVSAIADLMDSGDPFLAAVVTRGSEVVGVAHLGRRPNAHQQSALQWLYPTCGAEGCSALARLEVDHRAEWAKTRFTALDLLDRLCSHHHALKTHHGWALVQGRGKRALVAPDDPRHPRHAERAPQPAATGPPGAA